MDEVLQGRREIRSCGWVTNQYGVWIQITGPDPRYILAEVISIIYEMNVA